MLFLSLNCCKKKVFLCCSGGKKKSFFDYFIFLDMKIIIPTVFGWGNCYNEKEVEKKQALSLKHSLLCQKAIHGLAENKPLKLGSKPLFHKVVSAFNKSTLLMLRLEQLWHSLI